MRGLFGLVSLLICAFIVLYLWSKSAATNLQTGAAAREQATQISGRSADGTPVSQSITTQAQDDPHGRFDGLLVMDVVAGGGMQTMYGLQKGDRIIGVEALTTSELNTGDLMKAMLADAYQRSQPIEVIRDGKEVTLPLPGAAHGASAQSQLDQLLGPTKNGAR